MSEDKNTYINSLRGKLIKTNEKDFPTQYATAFFGQNHLRKYFR
jgi:hypothetical protein